MSVTPSQFPTINLADLDGTETIWVQKNGVDYKLTTTSVKQYGGCDVYCTSLVIPTASVLTLNTVPLTLISAPGTGYAIEIISASMKMTYNSIAYATNTNIQLWEDSSAYVVGQAASGLAGTTNKFFKFGIEFISTLQMQENKAVKVAVETGNPTAGNSDIKIYVQYRIITL